MDDKIDDSGHGDRVRERPAVDAPPPLAPQEDARKRVQLGDSALAATPDPARAGAFPDADARAKRKPSPELEAIPDPREQMMRRQLDEFRAEHAGRMKEANGVEWVGSVVAAAVGSAIVHIGRQEYVEVALPADATPPEIGANVAIGRDGELTPVEAHEELMRQITPHERSL